MQIPIYDHSKTANVDPLWIKWKVLDEHIRSRLMVDQQMNHILAARYAAIQNELVGIVDALNDVVFYDPRVEKFCDMRTFDICTKSTKFSPAHVIEKKLINNTDIKEMPL